MEHAWYIAAQSEQDVDPKVPADAKSRSDG